MPHKMNNKKANAETKETMGLSIMKCFLTRLDKDEQR